jgi:hypothetical protein
MYARTVRKMTMSRDLIYCSAPPFSHTLERRREITVFLNYKGCVYSGQIFLDTRRILMTIQYNTSLVVGRLYLRR